MTRPGKHPGLLAREEEPANLETPPGLLRGQPVTPSERFYVRNHGPVPAVDAETHRVRVRGGARGPREHSLADLRARFPERSVLATLQCAGNRRQELGAVRPLPGELPWAAGAVGTARWTGVALADVLADAGVPPGARHVAFCALDSFRAGGESGFYGSSIELAKATRPEVLLAWAMNGEPLLPDHGAPLRVVVPGYIGARSVKWLDEVRLQAAPSDNHFQARSYKLFPPWVGAEDADWEQGLSLGELPVGSAILAPAGGTRHAPGPVRIEGYATAGGDRWPSRVEVSADGGISWAPAALDGEPAAWRWRLWTAELELGPGSHRVVARAWDSAGHTQPERPEAVWNFKGYLNTAWPAVRFEVGA